MPSRKQVSVKRGGKVTIEINKRGRVRARKPAADRRYGPPPALDEVRAKRTKTTVYLLDSTTGYDPSGDPIDTVGTAHAYKPEEIEFPDAGGFLDGGDGSSVPAKRYGGISATPWYAVEFVDDLPKIRVKNPNTGLVFKTIFLPASLTKTKSDHFGMVFYLGGKANAILQANGNWKADPTPDERLATVLAQIEAEGETPELVEIRDNILLEIEELEPANYTDKLRWDDEYREYAVPTARLDAKGTGRTWKIGTTGISFEPFNPFDTVNFKVTEGIFDDEEVAAPKLDGKTILYVLLAPQNWLCTSTCDVYNRVAPNDVQKQHFIGYQYRDAVTSPRDLVANFTSGSYSKDSYPTPPNQYDPTRVEKAVFDTIGGFEKMIALVSGGLTFGTDATPERTVLGQFFQFLGTGNQLVSNCHLKVETGNSHIEKHCGSFYWKDRFFNVYRKTERVNSSPFTIYNGRVDSPDNAGGVLTTGENYSYPYFDTHYPGHADVDMGTFIFDARP